MNTTVLSPEIAEQKNIGNQMYSFIEELFPLCRSITGQGTVETLRKIQRIIPMSIRAIPSGTPVYDWFVPDEWNINDAYIKDNNGRRIVDFRKNNLHVVNYSVPIHRTMSLPELMPHLYSLPDQPDLIPYRTTYYKKDWGFCISHNQLQSLDENQIYEVCIDSTLQPGHLHYGEVVLQGYSDDEVLISTHICHPSMCNDNLSGIAVATYLAKSLRNADSHYTYRFLFLPATIGPIVWLALNEDKVGNIKHGLIAALLGNDAPFTYQRSRSGNTETDKIVSYLLGNNKQNRILDFVPYGYDQRQFCSPGFNLPLGTLTRSVYGEFPEYHTSADNLDFIKPWALQASLELYQDFVSILERNRTYINTRPKTEPQLGRRGLYNSLGGNTHKNNFQMVLLWVLNFSDGDHSLLDIALRSGIPFNELALAADRLMETDLLKLKS